MICQTRKQLKLGRPAAATQDRWIGLWMGQALVEFALVLPILLLLLIGIFQIGIALNTQQIITQATWEGARTGATTRDPVQVDNQIVTAVKQAAISLDVDKLAIHISPAQSEPPRNLPGPMPRGQPLQVTVVYTVTLNVPMEFDFPISAQAITRMEYSNP